MCSYGLCILIRAANDRKRQCIARAALAAAYRSLNCNQVKLPSILEAEIIYIKKNICLFNIFRFYISLYIYIYIYLVHPFEHLYIISYDGRRRIFFLIKNINRFFKS